MMMMLKSASAAAARTSRPAAVRAFASNIGEMDVGEVVRSRKTNMSKTYDGFQTFKDPVVLERAEGQYCYGPDGTQCVVVVAELSRWTFLILKTLKM